MNQLSIYLQSNRLKTAGLLIINLLLSLWLYNPSIFDDKDNALVDQRDILFKTTQPARDQKIITKGPFPKNFSFFIDIKTNFTPKKNYSHTILDGGASKIRFMLHQRGDLRMYWGSDKLHLKLFTAKSKRFFVKSNRWYQIGFVYRNGRLTTYINDKLFWDKQFPHPLSPPPQFTLLPVKPGKNLATGSLFIGKARRAVFLNNALSNTKVKELYLYRQYKKRGFFFSRLFLLFVVLNVLSHFLTNFLGMLFCTIKESNADRLKTGLLKTSLLKLGLLFLVNTVLFVIFNLGHTAANYINSLAVMSKETIYFYALNIIFFAILFSYLLEKLTDFKLSRCFLLSVNILLFFILICIISTHPDFSNVIPFAFNILFAILYTSIVGSIEIMQMNSHFERQR